LPAFDTENFYPKPGYPFSLDQGRRSTQATFAAKDRQRPVLGRSEFTVAGLAPLMKGLHQRHPIAGRAGDIPRTSRRAALVNLDRQPSLSHNRWMVNAIRTAVKASPSVLDIRQEARPTGEHEGGIFTRLHLHTLASPHGCISKRLHLQTVAPSNGRSGCDQGELPDDLAHGVSPRAFIIVSANLNGDQPRSSRRTLRKPILFEAFSVTSVLSVVNHSHKVAVAMIIAYMSNIQTAGESPCSACSDLFSTLAISKKSLRIEIMAWKTISCN